MIGGDLNSDSSQPDYSLLNERNSEALPNRMVLVLPIPFDWEELQLSAALMSGSS